MSQPQETSYITEYITYAHAKKRPVSVLGFMEWDRTYNQHRERKLHGSTEKLLTRAHKLLYRQAFDRVHLKTFVGSDGRLYRIHVCRKAGEGIGNQTDIRHGVKYGQRAFMLDKLSRRINADKARRSLVSLQAVKIRNRIRKAIISKGISQAA